MTSLTVKLWPSVAEFRQAVSPALRQTEAANNLLLGLMENHSDAPFPIMATVEDAMGLSLTALQTDPFSNLILSFSQRIDAAVYLADYLAEVGANLPGVLGPVTLAQPFAERWSGRTGASWAISVQERIFSIQKVECESGNLGELRWASQSDRDWLCQWLADFIREALPHDHTERIAENVAKRLEEFPRSGFLILEENARPRCLAGFAGPTGSGIRVGPVFTPPHLRNKGYASYTVRALTFRLLQWGYASVFLFTDLANPTSNSIYQKMGYQPVIDVTQYRFR